MNILNKRDENGEERLYEHFSDVIRTEDDPVLGHVPKLFDARDARPFVNRLISEFMGANHKKGLSFTWILDHLRDGNGRALPRTLVWLIEIAAEIERDQPRATGGWILPLFRWTQPCLRPRPPITSLQSTRRRGSPDRSEHA